MTLDFQTGGLATVWSWAWSLFMLTMLLAFALNVLRAVRHARRDRGPEMRQLARRHGLSYSANDTFGDMRRRLRTVIPEQGPQGRGERFVQASAVAQHAAQQPGAQLLGLPLEEDDDVRHVMWGTLDNTPCRLFEHNFRGYGVETVLLVDLQVSAPWPRTTIERHATAPGELVDTGDDEFHVYLAVTSDDGSSAHALLSQPLRNLLTEECADFSRVEVGGRWLLVRRPGELNNRAVTVLMGLGRGIRAAIPPHPAAVDEQEERPEPSAA